MATKTATVDTERSLALATAIHNLAVAALIQEESQLSKPGIVNKSVLAKKFQPHGKNPDPVTQAFSTLLAVVHHEAKGKPGETLWAGKGALGEAVGAAQTQLNTLRAIRVADLRAIDTAAAARIEKTNNNGLEDCRKWLAHEFTNVPAPPPAFSRDQFTLCS